MLNPCGSGSPNGSSLSALPAGSMALNGSGPGLLVGQPRAQLCISYTDGKRTAGPNLGAAGVISRRARQRRCLSSGLLAWASTDSDAIFPQWCDYADTYHL